MKWNKMFGEGIYGSYPSWDAILIHKNDIISLTKEEEIGTNRISLEVDCRRIQYIKEEEYIGDER